MSVCCSPWMMGEIVHLTHERDRDFLKNSKRPNMSGGTENSLSLVPYMKKRAKSDFTANKNDEVKQPKKLWQLLKSLGTS